MILQSGVFGGGGWTERLLYKVMPLSSVLFVLALSGCATLMDGSMQAINIQTAPEGAQCVVDGFKIATPGIVVLRRDIGPDSNLDLDAVTSDTRNILPGQGVTVRCRLAGFKDATATITHSVNGWIIGNVFTGIVPGLLIDAISGANRELQPQIIRIPFQKEP